jgi:hypothetical protein
LSFFYGESFPGYISTGVQNVVSKGACWGSGGITVSPDSFGGISCLKVSGFVDPAAPYNGVLNYRALVTIQQNGNKTVVAGNIHYGKCVDITTEQLPNSGSNGEFYILFWDLMTQNPFGAWNPIPYNRLDQFLLYFKLQIIITR